MSGLGLQHDMIHIDAWTPDIRPHVPDCPTPVIEKAVREAIIESCERARIWRWNMPEIPITTGQCVYTLPTPSATTCVHSILNVKLNEKDIPDIARNYGGQGYHIPDRGFIELLRTPTKDSRSLVEIEGETIAGAEPYHRSAVRLVNGALNLDDFIATINYSINGGNFIEGLAQGVSSTVDQAIANINTGVDGLFLLERDPDENEILIATYTGGDLSVTRFEIEELPSGVDGNVALVFDFGQASTIVERVLESIAEAPVSSTTVGLEVLATIKPSRDCFKVSTTVHKDYHDLIMEGALTRLLKMPNQEWSNTQLHRQYKTDFNYSLNRARQQIDRGFNTGSQKIKSRRFF